MTLLPLDIINKLIEFDEKNPAKQSELLVHYYNTATIEEKKAINNIMICICGHSLDAIINKPEQLNLK